MAHQEKKAAVRALGIAAWYPQQSGTHRFCSGTSRVQTKRWQWWNPLPLRQPSCTLHPWLPELSLPSGVNRAKPQELARSAIDLHPNPCCSRVLHGYANGMWNICVMHRMQLGVHARCIIQACIQLLLMICLHYAPNDIQRPFRYVRMNACNECNIDDAGMYARCEIRHMQCNAMQCGVMKCNETQYTVVSVCHVCNIWYVFNVIMAYVT